ncbi:hypothetical protein J6590_014811 [Homalodisca vitripennis]|nr:hypothetical protein J6590_014811 [Homalodisca vitripennis]
MDTEYYKAQPRRGPLQRTSVPQTFHQDGERGDGHGVLQGTSKMLTRAYNHRTCNLLDSREEVPFRGHLYYSRMGTQLFYRANFPLQGSSLRGTPGWRHEQLLDTVRGRQEKRPDVLEMQKRTGDV